MFGDRAPPDMFIAKILGQKTLEITEFVTELPYSQSQIGEWLFAIRACIDRREEPYGTLDCDFGES